MAKLKASAYVDGSFKPQTSFAGSAVLLFTNPNHHPHQFAFHRHYITLNKYGSNIAEINAVKTAIKAANSLGVTDLTIYHDWDGLAYFAYKSNIKPRHKDCPCYIQYAEFIERKRMNMRIRFVKVKAHSDNKLNNSVDRIARVGMVI